MSNKVKYMNRDFDSLQASLDNFIKSYYPDTYNDFHKSSVGGMLRDVAAYVGDVLSYYTDSAVNEVFDPSQRMSAIALAKLKGYKPKAAISSTGTVDITIEVPASGSSSNKVPDTNYCPIIPAGTLVQSTTTPVVKLETIADCNFAITESQLSDEVVTVLVSQLENDIPTHFTITKSVPVQSGESKTYTFNLGAAQKYLKLQLPSTNVAEIVSVVDSDGNTWYEVESLAQSTIFVSQKTTNDDSLATPYTLKLKRTSKRFEVEIDKNNLTYLLFGPGTEEYNDEQLIPSPENVYKGNESSYDIAINPENFLKTKTFGEAPHNTIITVTYRESRGITDNVPSNRATKIQAATFTFPVALSLLESAKVSDVKTSITCNNPQPILGGRGIEDIDSIKYKSMLAMGAQRRCVTRQDYMIRAMALPSKFGSISKVYVDKDKNLLNSVNTNENFIANEVINLYALAYDENQNLSTLTDTTKKNLKTYLSQYRMLTDSVNILDGKIINFKINVQITVDDDVNKGIVIARTINKIKDFFHISKWNFNQQIILSDLYEAINNVPDVKNVPKVALLGISGGDYSSTTVDFDAIIYKGIVYPPDDIIIFELKNPDINIQVQII